MKIREMFRGRRRTLPFLRGEGEGVTVFELFVADGGGGRDDGALFAGAGGKKKKSSLPRRGKEDSASHLPDRRKKRRINTIPLASGPAKGKEGGREGLICLRGRKS